ncbi:MAG: hypothetical protein KDD55_02820, partial [Bdellovibrionales bacterium]|nr:hypothetical protein [Bdellovibrionales bacterium]
ELVAHRLNRNSLYSNTPSDFDFKLAEIGKALSQEELIECLQSVDLVFPVIHGAYGEDGELQSFLEALEVPFVGAGSKACQSCFDKFIANELIREHGFFAPQTICFEKQNLDGALERLDAFIQDVDSERVVVKPATGGSSIGVHTAKNAEEALTVLRKLFEDGLYDRVVVEPFCTGLEFTVVLVQNRFGLPVALMPIEIETDYSDFQIFDFRKKYLPTRQVAYHCPPRFAPEVVEQIMIEAEQLFSLFGMTDFARFDGWLLPDGNIWFSDFNPISGMEQNSFLFVAGARVGLTHADVLSYILTNASHRQNVTLPNIVPYRDPKRESLQVIFGGDTAERQVSVMSGTNAWLLLRKSDKYAPDAYFLDADSVVWKLPYAIALNHTAEEIASSCKHAEQGVRFDSSLRTKVQTRLADPAFISQHSFVPERMKLSEFFDLANFVFFGLHGGAGENGELQQECENRGLGFNGSGSKACQLCVNKFAFGKFVREQNIPGVTSLAKKLIDTTPLSKDLSLLDTLWGQLEEEIGKAPYVVKPNDDGCSAGVCRIDTVEHLRQYCSFLFQGVERIPAGVFHNASSLIEMPTTRPRYLLLERFIETDDLSVNGQTLDWESVSGWVEITVGVLEEGGVLRSLNPSISVASEAILSVEEKFQGGTGINITPPPSSHVSPDVVERAKQGIESVSRAIGIRGYARFDAFLEIQTGELILIEVNNLPALTPSTVIFQQALAEFPPIPPRRFLEILVESGRV